MQLGSISIFSFSETSYLILDECRLIKIKLEVPLALITIMMMTMMKLPSAALLIQSMCLPVLASFSFILSNCLRFVCVYFHSHYIMQPSMGMWTGLWLLLPQPANSTLAHRFSFPFSFSLSIPLSVCCATYHHYHHQYLALHGVLLVSSPIRFVRWKKSGDTALHLAVMNGHLEAAQTLIELGSDIEATNPKNRDWTPLFTAVFDSFATTDKMVQLLITHGANMQARDSVRHHLPPLPPPSPPAADAAPS